jgi:hypothetical protein
MMLSVKNERQEIWDNLVLKKLWKSSSSSLLSLVVTYEDVIISYSFNQTR